MNPIDWSQFEDVEPEAQQPQQIQQPQINWDQFEDVEDQPKQSKKEEPFDSRIEYMRQHGVSEADIEEFKAEDPLREFQGSKETYKEAPRGILSGITAGFSELIPGFKPEGDAGTANKVIGSVAPIGWGAKVLSWPLRKAVEKSPIIAKGLTSFAELIGLSTAGGIYGGLEESAEKTGEQGKFVPPSLDTILEHGLQWAALDTALKALGWGGRFGKALFEKMTSTGKSAETVLEELATQIGTDATAEKAISILENKPLETVQKEAASQGNPIGGNTAIAGEADLLPKTERKVKVGGKSDVVPPSKTQEYAELEFGTRPADKGIDIKNKKISKKELDTLNSKEAPPIPYLPGEFQFEKIGEEALSNDVKKQVESIAERASSKKVLGENVQKEIETTIKEQKKKTDALYEEAAKVEETNRPNTKKTADAILEQIKKIEKGDIKLTPEGYKKAKQQLVQTLTDIGYGVQTGENGLIINVIQDSKQPLSKVVEVKRRLNNIINYDLIDTSAQDFLKGPAAALRQDIRVGYGPKNSKARKAFEQAEKEFGEFAEQKGRKSIRNLRMSETPEAVANVIRTPSGLADIKQVVSPAQFAQVEREILEHLQTMKQESAANLYRELRSSLSPETRSVAEQIIESKAAPIAPTRQQAQKDAIKRKILDSLSESVLTGQRPKAALDLYKTKEGQRLINEALEHSPNKKEVLQYLKDQSFKDFSAAVVSPDGKIDFKKLNEMLKDPMTVENLRQVAGEEGVNFLKNLETLSKNAEKNASLLERTISKGTASERKKLSDEVDKLGKKRIEQIKNKNTALSKEEEAFQSKFDKEAKKNRKEVEESLRSKGEERIKKSKEKRQAKNKAEKEAEANADKIAKEAIEAAEKATLRYKIDDLIGSYGVTGKGALAALGIWKIGTIEGLSLTAGYEIIKKLSKNKTLREAVKKASIKPKNNVDIVRAIIAIEDEADQ